MSGTLHVGTEADRRLRGALVRLRTASLWADALSRLAPQAHLLDEDLPLLSRRAFLSACQEIRNSQGGSCITLNFPHADARALHVAGIVLFETLRRTDIIGRFGQRTLAVALPGCPPARARNVCTRIERALLSEAARTPQAATLARGLHAEIIPLAPDG